VTSLAGTPEVVAVGSAGELIPNPTVSLVSGTLSVSSPGFLTWSETFAPDSPGRLKVVLFRPAAFTGRVESREGPVENVHILASGSDGRKYESFSDEQGEYQLDRLPPGLYRLIYEKENYITSEQVVSLRESERVRLQAELRPASWLQVRILNAATGEGLSGVAISVITTGRAGRFLPEGEHRRAMGLRAETDERGTARFGPLSQDVRYRIAFEGPEHATVSIDILPTSQVIARDVSLPASGTIRVSLRDVDSGRPVSDAVASLASDDAVDVDLIPPPSGSDDDGVLLARSVPPGTYVVRLRAPGFKPQTLRGATVEMGESVDLGVVLLEPGREVSGIVLGEADEPLQGANVEVSFFEEGRKLKAEDQTDEEGRFTVSGLPEDALSLEVLAEDYLPFRERWTQIPSSDINVNLMQERFIEGRVAEEETLLPVTSYLMMLWLDEESGRPSRPEQSAIAVNDSEGHFRVGDLKPGKHSIRIRARGYRDTVISGVLAHTKDFEPQLIVLERGNSLRGLVLDAQSRSPIPGTSIRVNDLPQVLADQDGNFEVHGCEARVRILAEHPEYVPKVLDDVQLYDGQAIELLLSRGGAVEGVVFGLEGSPLSGATVLVRLASTERTSQTDTNGHYLIDGLPAGQWRISKVNVPGSYEGYEEAAVNIQVGLTSTHNFGVGSTLYGAISYLGDPASYAVLTLTRILSSAQPGRPVMSSYSTRSHEDGSYEITGIDPGTYGLTVLWQSRKVGKQVVVPKGGGNQLLDITLLDLWLTGEVFETDTQSPLRGTVLVTKKADGPSASLVMSFGDGSEELQFDTNPQANVETDDMGRFRASVMEPGRYQVIAFVSGYQQRDPIELDVLSQVDGVMIAMSPSLEIAVRAVDSLTGATIREGCRLLTSGGTRSTICGQAITRFSSLASGSCRVTAWAPGYAVGYKTMMLESESEEIDIPLSYGGAIRVLLPAVTNGDQEGLIAAGLRIEDASGVELTDLLRTIKQPIGSWFVPLEANVVLIGDIPSGIVSVAIGGGSMPLSFKEARVAVEEGHETLVDFR
jgi:hypothetical protein